MLLNKALQLDRADRIHRLRVHIGVDAALKRVALLIGQKVAPSTSLAGADVAADGAEDDDDATGHVLTAVVTRALHNRLSVRIAHAEALAGHALREELAAGCAIQAGVADDRGLRWLEADLAPLNAVDRADADAPTMHALANIVVRVAADLEVEAGEAREAKRLARASGVDQMERALPSSVAVLLRDGARDARGCGAVDVGDRELDRLVLVVVDGRLDVVHREQLVIDRVLLGVDLLELDQALALLCGLQSRDVLDEGEIQLGRLRELAITLLE